ncbi:alpha-L-fucosidase [Echinicola pacifica]|uniref:alpha-L-fucosidase n=1 Tax=Echinicola pacifica TaxID=346377 RepID=A0A918USN9_9BACT|nr:alpha-L-fucosidase [Echinicola pacifica]GGZ30503.1 alpha-L-fucosidase [Echinicola pacifica]
MKIKYIALAFTLLLAYSQMATAQKYEADWASLDQRPIPGWFEDAKFGIFIHWGPYSVPAWSPKGTYSEWYQYWLQSKSLFGNGDFKGDEVYEYHKKTYGDDFTYYDFGPEFTADLFDPEAWASLFEKAGAKYIVLTSKHHDGFTLWPNEQANDRGFAWNSMEVGAKRDLVGELTQAVRQTEVKMGLYYSLYEWYHPLWLSDKDKFVDQHYLPQVKDLVQRYQPDILWTDGEWEIEDTQWRSEEFLAWLYNESAAKDYILVNDRWGKGLRQKHGGYYTTEYEAGKVFDKPWEECRGMGFSFGYNQNEDAWDYNSTQALLLMLIDIVSNGGNLLLDIGPDHRGNIPPIMQERLMEMGEWLAKNGEAIYGTRPWKQSVQWSEGDRTIDHSGSYLGGDYILKQTVDKQDGKAVKEVFFTQNDKSVFAIIPDGSKQELVLKGLKADKRTTVRHLGSGKTLTYKQKGDDLHIMVPEEVLLGSKMNLPYSIKLQNVQ